MTFAENLKLIRKERNLSQEELLTVAAPNEQAIINTFLSLKKGSMVDFIPMSDALFVWAKQWISENS